jgi:tetratricopeptide (TPR) repeat protein
MGKLAMQKNRLKSILPLLIILALIAGLFANCSWWSPSARKQKYYKSAESFYQKDKYHEAAIQLQNAIKIDPKYADAHYLLAQCYLKSGMWPGAFAELNRTVVLAPRNWQAQIDLGDLLLASRQFQQAEDKAKLVLAAEPQNVAAHTLNAKAIAALGNPPGSLDEMQAAIRIAPNQSSSYLNLALLQLNARQIPEAGTVTRRR